MDMTLTLRHDATIYSGIGDDVYLDKGDMVEYICHTIGGMILVRYCNHEYIMNPNATNELCN